MAFIAPQSGVFWDLEKIFMSSGETRDNPLAEWRAFPGQEHKVVGFEGPKTLILLRSQNENSTRETFEDLFYEKLAESVFIVTAKIKLLSLKGEVRFC